MLKIAIFIILAFCFVTKTNATLEGIQTEYQIPLDPEFLRQSTPNSLLASIQTAIDTSIRVDRQTLSYTSYDKIKFHLDNEELDKKLTIRLRHFNGTEEWQLTVKYNSPTLGEIMAWQITPNPKATSKIEQDIFPHYTKFAYSRTIFLTKKPTLERVSQLQSIFPELIFLTTVTPLVALKSESQTILCLSGLKVIYGSTSLKMAFDITLPDAKSAIDKDLSRAVAGELSFKVKKPDLHTYQLAHKLFGNLSQINGVSQNGPVKNPSYYFRSIASKLP